jgi:hypothetical protein
MRDRILLANDAMLIDKPRHVRLYWLWPTEEWVLIVMKILALGE